MEIFKFSGNVKEGTQRKEKRVKEFQGEFIQEENDEIIGIMDGGRSIIKGLFIDNVQLIFIEITSAGHVYGYAFKDIHKTGYFDRCDWLSGLFSGEGGEEEAEIKVEIGEHSKLQRDQIKNVFRRAYDNLTDWNQSYFKNVQDLRDYINFKA